MPTETQEQRFMVDHMLIKLGKYLRIIGYDAEWDNTLRTHELILKANAENRLFITRNSRISHEYPRPERAHVLGETDPVRQLLNVVSSLALDRLRRLRRLGSGN